MEMNAERWIKELEVWEKARHDVLAKEKAEADEEQRIGQESERRAWMRELGRKA
jgi:predicted dithiol-disulfide oxidoreductase (DUF899 family)